MSRLERYRQAITEPELYWLEAAAKVSWTSAPTMAMGGTSVSGSHWYQDATTNLCYNAVDRHVENGRGDQNALIYESPVTTKSETYTYSALQFQVAKTAGILRDLGVGRGDPVIIYMPMIPQAVFAMLACARIGAIHSVVFGGFAARELAKRIDDAKPKLVIAASCGVEPTRLVEYKPLLDDALSISEHQPEHCLIYQRDEVAATMLGGRDLDWQFMFSQATAQSCVSIAATDPSYILYTSGTTGTPKGVVRDTGGHMVALIQSMAQIYDAKPGDVFWAASDIGWVVGHSYIVYAPLLIGAATVLYEGKPVGTPDAGAFWRVIDKHQVNILFTAPTAFRAIKGADINGEFIKQAKLSSLRALFLAGERADTDTIAWAETHLKVPVIDHWWQTELGWPALASCLGLDDSETLAGSAGKAVPGFDVCIVGPNQQVFDAGESGEIVIRLPLPPGAFTGLWQNDSGFINSYFSQHPGFYTTGDTGFIDQQGFVHVMGRTDDLINVAGHRLSTSTMEQVVAEHPDVAEVAVIGADDKLKGQVPVGLVVLNAGVAVPESGVSNASRQVILDEIVSRVRSQVGPVASFKHVCIVSQLPKTRSGKILRGTLRHIANGVSFDTPATIDDPNTLDIAADALKTIGLT